MNEKFETNVDPQIFDEANRRYQLSYQKKGTEFFIYNGRSILKVHFKEKSSFYPLKPLYVHPGEEKDHYLEPGTLWAMTEEELETKIPQPDDKTPPPSTCLTPKITSSKSITKIPKPDEVSFTITSRHLEMQNALKSSLFNPNQGGIDWTDISKTTNDLFIKMAYPVLVFEVKEMEEIVQEGFIHPLLYWSFQKEFDELLNSIKIVIIALKTLYPQISEDSFITLQNDLFNPIIEAIRNFLIENQDRIQITQIILSSKRGIQTALGAVIAYAQAPSSCRQGTYSLPLDGREIKISDPGW